MKEFQWTVEQVILFEDKNVLFRISHFERLQQIGYITVLHF